MPDLTSPVTGAVFLDDPRYPVIEPFDRDWGRAGMIAPMPGPWGPSTYGLATNVVRAVRFVPSRDMAVTKIALAVTTGAGVADPIDVGIYNTAGIRLGSSGSKQPDVGTDLTSAGVKVYNLTATVRLVAKTVYYAAICSAAPGGAAAQVAAMTFAAGGGLGALFGSVVGTTELDTINQAPPLPASLVLTGNSGGASVGPVLALRET